MRDLVPAIWLPDPQLRREREQARFRLHRVKHRTSLKNRIHSTLIAFGHQRAMSDLFGVAGRKLFKTLDIPEPWRGHLEASVVLIDDLTTKIDQIEAELRRSGVDHRYVPLLLTAPGIGWVLGYTGLCPRVKQSGAVDLRGALSKHGPKYLRWALIEAAQHAASHPLYCERYQQTKRRLGKQRGPNVAKVDLARRLTEAIWYMLTRNQPFAPAGATFRLAA